MCGGSSGPVGRREHPGAEPLDDPLAHRRLVEQGMAHGVGVEHEGPAPGQRRGRQALAAADPADQADDRDGPVLPGAGAAAAITIEMSASPRGHDARLHARRVAPEGFPGRGDDHSAKGSRKDRDPRRSSSLHFPQRPSRNHELTWTGGLGERVGCPNGGVEIQVGGTPSLEASGPVAEGITRGTRTMRWRRRNHGRGNDDLSVELRGTMKTLIRQFPPSCNVVPLVVFIFQGPVADDHGEGRAGDPGHRRPPARRRPRGPLGDPRRPQRRGAAGPEPAVVVPGRPGEALARGEGGPGGPDRRGGLRRPGLDPQGGGRRPSPACRTTSASSITCARPPSRSTRPTATPRSS